MNRLASANSEDSDLTAYLSLAVRSMDHQDLLWKGRFWSDCMGTQSSMRLRSSDCVGMQSGMRLRFTVARLMLPWHSRETHVIPPVLGSDPTHRPSLVSCFIQNGKGSLTGCVDWCTVWSGFYGSHLHGARRNSVPVHSFSLTLSMLGKKNQQTTFWNIFPEIIGFDLLCKLSP